MDIEELLEEELQEAVGNLEIGEDDDEQEMLLTMIRNLQMRAFGRGLELGQTQSGATTAVVQAEDATTMVASLLRDGAAEIRITVA